jgi:23S rRNA (adenine2503-C2)-methyltransferase
MSESSVEKHERVFAAPEKDQVGRRTLIGLSLPELQDLLQGYQIPNFRAKQVWHWMYHRGVQSFDEMNNIPKDLKAQLNDNFSIGRPEIVNEQTSVDGTIKWLMKMQDGQMVETVFIPEDTRGTLCISSQVGCTLTCKFCHTGTQKLVRNLGAHEILQQVMHARDVLGEWAGKRDPNDKREFSNIVLMGMGEPLYNYQNIAKAMKICMDADGLAISKRRITLSTSGVVPMIEKCGQELNVNLAISLHAANDRLRSDIMPINNKYPLADLMQACRNYPLDARRRITFEYVMLKGVNDSDDDAHNLVTLLGNIPSKVNIIPFNPWPGAEYECSSRDRIEAFAKIIQDAGIDSPIRKTRGEDILAACGQLKSASERIKVTETK